MLYWKIQGDKRLRVWVNRAYPFRTSVYLVSHRVDMRVFFGAHVQHWVIKFLASGVHQICKSGRSSFRHSIVNHYWAINSRWYTRVWKERSCCCGIVSAVAYLQGKRKCGVSSAHAHLVLQRHDVTVLAAVDMYHVKAVACAQIVRHACKRSAACLRYSVIYYHEIILKFNHR